MLTIIASDLDGTLLDSTTYRYDSANTTIIIVQQQRGIFLIICTSKTRSEIEDFRKEIGNRDPFISENGAALFIPRTTFHFDLVSHLRSKGYSVTENDTYIIVVFGTPYAMLLDAIQKIKGRGFLIRGFNDMSAEEISIDTGLDLRRSRLSKAREFDEAFALLNGDDEKLKDFIAELGFNCSKGGRYWHIMGNNDKGRALRILLDLYRQEYSEEIRSIGLGDSENDFSMLDVVDEPILIRRRGQDFPTKKYFHQDCPAPEGWKIEVEKILNGLRNHKPPAEPGV